MKKYYFECACNADEHRLVLVEDEYKGHKELYFTCFIQGYQSIFRRIWMAIKYIFNKTNDNGMFDCFIIKDSDIKRYADIFNKIATDIDTGNSNKKYKIPDLTPLATICAKSHGLCDLRKGCRDTDCNDCLQDLLLNDPIISQGDRKRVLNVYSRVVAASPVLAKNKEVMRSILRAAVQTEVIDDYDIKLWINIGERINDINRSKTLS